MCSLLWCDFVMSFFLIWSGGMNHEITMLVIDGEDLR